MKNVTAEPIYDNKNNYQNELLRLISWYRTHKDRDDAEKYIRAYAKNNSVSVDVKKITTTIGWLCRIVIVAQDNDIIFDQQVTKKIQDSFKLNTSTETEKAIEVADKVSVKKNIENKLKEYLADFDQAIDEIMYYASTSFNATDYLRHENVNHYFAKEISIEYNKLLKELYQAFNKEDEQLAEAYSHIEKRKFKKIINEIETLVTACDEWCVTQKQISQDNRKPRKKKEVPLDVQVKKMKYLKEFNSIQGLRAEKIIGAKQVWLFDTKKKRLCVYNCANELHGIQVKGTSLQNFDIKTSNAKTLRKPERLSEIKDMGKIAIRKCFQDLKSKEYALNGRINENQIIIKIF